MSVQTQPKLFSSFQLGPNLLASRIVMAPMTRSRAVDNIPNDLMAEHYAERAGAGLIITEGTAPSANGLGYARIPGCYSDAQVHGWKRVVDAVHAAGGKIFLQIMHCGRVAHPLNLPEGGRVLAPSPDAAPGEMYTDQQGMQPFPVPTEMTEHDVAQAISEYAACARRAVHEAGFDGVEIHGANGYLVEQFINPISNQRTDGYGGSVTGRTRFAIEVLQAVSKAVGASHVGMRLSPYGAFNGMGYFEGVEPSYRAIAEAAAAEGLAYLHVVDHSSMGAPEVPASIKALIRQAFNGPIILSGGYDAARAEADLAANLGELVAFGRPFMANPDLVEKLKLGGEVRQPDMSTAYTPGAHGYNDYPVG